MKFDVDALVARYLTEKIDANQNDLVGVEVELPFGRRDGREPDMDVVRDIENFIWRTNFWPDVYDDDGTVLHYTDLWFNDMKFDTVYSTIEYMSAPKDSLLDIRDKFLDFYPMMQACFNERDHLIICMGVNQTRGALHSELARNETTQLIDRVIKANGSNFNFYRRICSEQVHFNTTSRDLPKLLCMLTYVSPASILVFANSPFYYLNDKCVCVRNEYYRHSCFTKMGLTGSLPLGADTLEQYVEAHKKMCIYYRRRDGKLQEIPPTPVEEYFTDPKYDAQEEDIWCLDPVKNVVVTQRGTVEYRLNDTQISHCAFVPSAFMLGLKCNIDKALDCCREFYERHNITDVDWINSYAARRGVLPRVSRDETIGWLNTLLDISFMGLKERGYGEHRLLDMVRRRPDILYNQSQEYYDFYKRYPQLFLGDYAGVPWEMEWYEKGGKFIYRPNRLPSEDDTVPYIPPCTPDRIV